MNGKLTLLIRDSGDDCSGTSVYQNEDKDKNRDKILKVAHPTAVLESQNNGIMTCDSAHSRGPVNDRSDEQESENQQNGINDRRANLDLFLPRGPNTTFDDLVRVHDQLYQMELEKQNAEKNKKNTIERAGVTKISRDHLQQAFHSSLRDPASEEENALSAQEGEDTSESFHYVSPQKNGGDVLASKTFQRISSEAENIANCHRPAVHKHDPNSTKCWYQPEYFTPIESAARANPNEFSYDQVSCVISNKKSFTILD